MFHISQHQSSGENLEPFASLRRQAAQDHCWASGLLSLHDMTAGHHEQHNVNGRILMVEADVELSAVLEEVLCHSGYTVITVETSEGELGLIHSASAVILDVDTTAADKELARLSLLQRRRETLPIVLMGVQLPENLDQRLKSHFIRLQSKHVVWVQKPFRNEELLAAVRQAQEGCVSGLQIEPHHKRYEESTTP